MLKIHADAESIAASLDLPGKGLPRHELFIARLMVGWRARRTSRAESERLFSGEWDRIRKLVQSATDEQLARRVLIPRLRGMEDSSRYWSVYMTLDHLRIVNDHTTELVGLLARDRTPSRVTGTADVKPDPQVDSKVVDAFERSCTEFQRVASSIADLKTQLRWPHPWFGPLNAERWHFFAGFHMGLHRKQIESILKSL